MSIRKLAAPAAIALAVALGGTGLAVPVFAQAQAPAAAPQAQAPEHHHRFDPVRAADGRIAYLKAYLKITNAQEPQFDRVAQVIRENTQDRAKLAEQHRADRDQSMNAVERLEARQRFAALHAQHSERFLTAFKPLYASLSDAQKQAADQLLAGHGHYHRHG
jgi:periplasmic protein CpxP/Spy